MTVSAVSPSPQRQEPPPPALDRYVVQRGDTLSEIARAHGVGVEGLLAANPSIRNPDVIYPDQAIQLPVGARALAAEAPTAVAAPAAGATPRLENGDRGPAVADLQSRLQDAGFDPGGIDGIFGSRTEAAVRGYQDSRGIGVDGIVGPRTWGQLNGGAPVEGPPASAPPAVGDVATVADGPSNARIAGLHPEVRGLAAEFVNRVESELGITLRVTQGTRTYAEQDALYAQGRTAPGDVVTNARGGYSNHNFGLAFDVVEIRADGSANWNTDWDALGRVAADVGLAWGGNWTTFVDRPHFELDAGLSTAQLRERVASGDTTDGFANLR